MSESTTNTDQNRREPANTAVLAEQLASVSAELANARQQNGRLIRRLTELETAAASFRESRRAALNLLEDAVESRERAEGLNEQLKREIADRERAETALRASEALLADELNDARRLQQLSSQLVRGDHPGDLYEQIVEAAASLMRSEAASLQRFARETNELELLASRGFAPESAAHWQRVGLGAPSTCGQAIASGQRVVVEDLDQPGCQLGESHVEHYRRSGLRAMQSTPLVARGGELVGVISTHWREPHAPTERALRLFDVLARQAADLIESHRAAAALRHSEQRLQTMANAVPQIIWANTETGDAVYFNRRWYEYTGLTEEQSLGPGWQGIVHPEDAQASGQRWREALARGEIFDCEYRLRGADGAYRWFIGRNVPLRDASGHITSWFGSATDIQDLKVAQSTAYEREEQLRRAIEDAPMPVIMHAEDGGLLQVNRAWTELTGYTRAEIPTLEAWLERVGEDAAKVREAVQHVFAGAQPIARVEFEITTRGGEHRHWLFGVSVPGTLPDGRRFAVGMALDLTERKRAEQALVASQERLRLIVESALEHAIISLDLDRRITSWNTGAERMLGYLRDEIGHERGDVIFTADDRAAGAPQREAEAALADGRAANERWHVRKDGSQFWGSGVTLPIYERPGAPPSGFIKILRDETERRAAEQALEVSRQQLLAALGDAERARADAEAATRAKDDFLAALSHELRTPLNPVLLLASEAAESDQLPPQVRENFSTIRDNVQLEARLIDDLLDLTRISRGKLLLQCQSTDAHAVLRETADIVRPDAVLKRIDFNLDLAAAHSRLHADPVRLAQVFWNVMKNAVKFTPEGGRVEVHTHNPVGGDRLLISVTDTGIGLTRAEIDRIFGAFVQGDHAQAGRLHQFGGLGLGLTISHMLVELHGGTIRAVSGGRGAGATFEIDFPVSQEPTPPDVPINGRSAMSSPQLGAERLRHEVVLLVEDHDATRDALTMLLRRRGFSVFTARSASEAMAIAAREKVTLLLSDIGLPDGDGYALMRELRERSNLRGVALTGYGTDEDLMRSRHAGFAAHLTKPISAQALDRILAELVLGDPPAQ